MFKNIVIKCINPYSMCLEIISRDNGTTIQNIVKAKTVTYWRRGKEFESKSIFYILNVYFCRLLLFFNIKLAIW